MTPAVGARSTSGSCARVAHHLAALAQALQLRFQVDELALRHGTALGQRTQTSQLCFRDRDQLLDLAELLQDRGAVGLRQMRLDLRQRSPLRTA